MGLVVCLWYVWVLDVFIFGDDVVVLLGIVVLCVCLIFFIIVVLIIVIIVSMVGLIGFVGLVVLYVMCFFFGLLY